MGGGEGGNTFYNIDHRNCKTLNRSLISSDIHV